MSMKANLQNHLKGKKHLKDIAIDEFTRAWRTGRMVAFVGSYTSEEFGYPSWSSFMEGRYPSAEGDDEKGVIELLKKKVALESAYDRPIDAAILETDIPPKVTKFDREGGVISYEETNYTSLILDLNINRFITLNYDIEIENAAMGSHGTFEQAREDREKSEEKRGGYDYRRARKTPDGKTVVSDTFYRERSDYLFDFAIGRSENSTHVFHLHGRIDDDATWIVTQDHYDKQYRKNGVSRLPFEHGLRTLFSGNPILFVGIGMSEDDLLWVLQEFVGDGSPSHIAPHFVLWSANSKTEAKKKEYTKNRQKPDKVSDDDELRRLRLYRKYGVHLIFDTELKAFSKDNLKWEGKNTGRARLKAAIRSLAITVRDMRIEGNRSPSEVDSMINGYRTMAGFLPNPSESQNKTSTNWHENPVIWPVIQSKSTFLPAPSFKPDTSKSELNQPTNSGDTKLERIPLSDIRSSFGGTIEDELGHWLTQAIRKEGPIKAFIDPPGSGHGYIASIIRKFATTSMRDWLLSRPPPVRSGGEQEKLREQRRPELICLQLNAGFAWEIDTTFSLLSGLYDGVLAFDRNHSAKRCSRHRSLLEWTSNVIEAIESKQPVKRNIVVIINGADRFFEKSGYPLSNELDLLLRRIPRLALLPEYYGWKSGCNYNVHPLTTVLLGSRRIERYLTSLELQVPANSRGTQISPVQYFRQRSADHGRYANRADDPQLTDLIRSNAPAQIPYPLRKEEYDWESAYLRSIVSAFEKEGFCSEDLPVGLKISLDRSRGRLGDEQRRGFFTVFLHPLVLAKVMGDSGIPEEAILKTLTLLAFIGQPIEADTLQHVILTPELHFLHHLGVEGILEKLLQLNLVLEIAPFPGEKSPRRFALHKALLHEMRDRSSVPITDAQTYTAFNLPLYSAQPVDEHEPARATQNEIDTIVDHLIDNKVLVESEKWDECSSRLRAAYASMRSYHTTSALLMYKPNADPITDKSNAVLGAYANRLGRIVDQMEELTFQGKNLKRKCAFPEDFVWLHDQRGVTLLSMGDLYEARHALNRAELFNDELVEVGDHDQNWCRIQVNQLQLDLERGKISHAESRILRLEAAINNRGESVQTFDSIIKSYSNDDRPRVRIVDPVFPSELVLLTGLVCGYKGWTAYIRGRLRTSQRFFEQSIKILLNLGEQRAYAHFMRIYASVHVALGKLDDARNTAALCVAAADSVRQMDISELARITLAEIDLMRDPRTPQGPILQQMQSTLRYATACDMYRVRMETRRAMAKLRMRQGDYDGALEQAAEGLAVATRFGYSLRKVSLRLMIGHILFLRGDPISGRHMINEAVQTADKVGYQRAVEQAQAILVELGVG